MLISLLHHYQREWADILILSFRDELKQFDMVSVVVGVEDARNAFRQFRNSLIRGIFVL